MQRPMFQDGPAALILLTHAGVFDPAKRLAAVHGPRQVRAGLGLRYHLVAVHRADGGVAVAVKHDGRDRT